MASHYMHCLNELAMLQSIECVGCHDGFEASRNTSTLTSVHAIHPVECMRAGVQEIQEGF
jgi:hypothetical protein